MGRKSREKMTGQSEAQRVIRAQKVIKIDEFTELAKKNLELIVKEHTNEIEVIIENVKLATLCPKCGAQNPQNSRIALEMYGSGKEPIYNCRACGHIWGGAYV